MRSKRFLDSPVQETANQALRAFLAEQPGGVSCCDVEIASGHLRGWKRMRLDGPTVDSIKALLTKAD